MSNTEVVYEDDSVRVALEPHAHYGLLVHVKSKQWSKRMYEHYIDVFIELAEQLQAKGFPCIYAAIKTKDKKLKKFARMFGFSDTHERVKDVEGVERGIYKCLI